MASFSDDLDSVTALHHAAEQAIHANALTIDKLGRHDADVHALTSIALSLVVVARTLVAIDEKIATLLREEAGADEQA